jgi:hypothetical protein
MPQSNRRSPVRLAAFAFLAGGLVAACGSAGSHRSVTTKAAPATTAIQARTAPPATPVTPARTATPATTASKAVTTGGGCYVGNWTSTNYTQQVQGQQIAGGAGIHFAITPGEMSINFTGMEPVTITGTISGQGIFLGQEEAPAAFSPSGTFALPGKGTSDVTFEAKLSGQTSYSPPIKAGGLPTGGISGTYTCSPATLALTVPTPQGPTTVTLARS